MKKVVLLGDSMLARLNRDDDKGWVSLFNELFPKVELLDLSYSGTNISYGLEQASNNTLESGTSVFVMFGTNDAASWKRVPIEEFESTYKKLLDVLVSEKCKITLITPPPVKLEKQAPPGRSNEELNKYSEVVRSLAKKYDVKLIDLYKKITKEMSRADVHSDDGVHLNEVGYRVLLKEMKAVL